MSQPIPQARLERAGFWLALLLCAALAWPLRHYVTDDTFIHLQYARHVAHGEGFVFNSGERVYGSTSPLWVLLLADAIATGADGLVASKLLGALGLFASLLLWSRLVRRTLASPWLRMLSTLVWAGHAWMLRWSLSGMETPLTVALVLGGMCAFTASEPWGEHPTLAGVLWALAALARPECGLLLFLWGVLLMVEHGPRAGLVRAARGLSPAALVYGGWLAFARGYFGTFWPNTLAAKAAGGVSQAYRWEQFTRQGAIVAATDGVLVLVLLGALAALARYGGQPRLRPAVRDLPWMWLVAVPLLYIVRGVPVLSRYLVPLLPILGWLAWRALDRALRLKPAQHTWLAGAVIAALVLGQNLYTYARIVRPQIDSFSAGMGRSLIPWGRWFDQHAAADAVIAAPDIGALGYFSRRRVVDLAGLVTPEMVPILRRMPEEDAVARFEFARFSRPDYVVDRASRPWDLTRRSPWRAALIPLGHASLPNLGVARPGEAVYSFYRIDWAAYDSLAATR